MSGTPDATTRPADAGPIDATSSDRPRFLYLQAALVALLGAVFILLWFLAYNWLNKAIWDNAFVTANRWMFPVICLPMSLLVGLLVKYLKAPTNLDSSVVDSLTGDPTKIKWKALPTTVVQSLASLLSGAVLGPEGAIGHIASQIAAWYCDTFNVPVQERPKLVFASVSAGYNGLLENPVFAAVLGTELGSSKEATLRTLPASLIGGGVGYAVFYLARMSGFANILNLPQMTTFQSSDIAFAVLLAFVGVALAVVAGAFMQAAERIFGMLKDRVVLRALAAGVVFSVVGYFAPILMFSGEAQVHTVIAHASSYAVWALLIMAVVKLALLAVAFKSGFLGGPTFPVLFASVCVALAISTVVPGVPVALLVAGIVAGALFVLFRAPLMVVLLTSFMLGAPIPLQGLIVLSVATAMIVWEPLQGVIQSRQAGAGAR
jgi:H+/Cl- antiporter ClcA